MSFFETAQDDNEGGGQRMSNPSTGLRTGIEQGMSNDEGRGTDVGDVQSPHKS